ncbi:MAG: GNAT family N-acetyltransferase [Tepidisphaeraceae bacterium]
MSDDSPAFTIRPGRPSDAASIAVFMIRLAWETESVRLNPSTVELGVKTALADESKGRYFVAVVDGIVVGCLMLTREWSDWRNADMWWIQSVYVDADARGRGVFKGLYAHVREMAQAAGVASIRLYVEKQNGRAKRHTSRWG